MALPGWVHVSYLEGFYLAAQVSLAELLAVKICAALAQTLQALVIILTILSVVQLRTKADGL